MCSFTVLPVSWLPQCAARVSQSSRAQSVEHDMWWGRRNHHQFYNILTLNFLLDIIACTCSTFSLEPTLWANFSPWSLLQTDCLVHSIPPSSSSSLSLSASAGGRTMQGKIQAGISANGQLEVFSSGANVTQQVLALNNDVTFVTNNIAISQKDGVFTISFPNGGGVSLSVTRGTSLNLLSTTYTCMGVIVIVIDVENVSLINQLIVDLIDPWTMNWRSFECKNPYLLWWRFFNLNDLSRPTWDAYCNRRNFLAQFNFVYFALFLKLQNLVAYENHMHAHVLMYVTVRPSCTNIYSLRKFVNAWVRNFYANENICENFCDYSKAMAKSKPWIMVKKKSWYVKLKQKQRSLANCFSKRMDMKSRVLRRTVWRLLSLYMVFCVHRDVTPKESRSVITFATTSFCPWGNQFLLLFPHLLCRHSGRQNFFFLSQNSFWGCTTFCPWLLSTWPLFLSSLQ